MTRRSSGSAESYAGYVSSADRTRQYELNEAPGGHPDRRANRGRRLVDCGEHTVLVGGEPIADARRRASNGRRRDASGIERRRNALTCRRFESLVAGHEVLIIVVRINDVGHSQYDIVTRTVNTNVDFQCRLDC
jgi:hypothetical protein